MSIISKRTYCDEWVENTINYLIQGKSTLSNYWCSGKIDLSPEINIIDDELEIHNENNSYLMVGKIIAYGKTQYSSPQLQPTNTDRDITVEDIFHIEVRNNQIVFTNQVPSLHTTIGSKYTNHSSNVLNGLKETDTIEDFMFYINDSLQSKDYVRSSDFAYIIFEPYVISNYGINDPAKKKMIDAFNKKNESKRNKRVHIDSKGVIRIH